MEKKYGFYGRLKEAFPSQVIADITENCNYACRHCPHADFAKSSVYTNAFLPEELNRKMVDEVAADGRGLCTHIRYTANGEPLLHPQVFDMVSYAASHSGTMVSLTTNGSLLTEDNRKKLLDTGIGLIDISLDANSEETYEKIRINGNWERVKWYVLALLDERKRGGYKTRIVVSFVKQPLNIHETEDFERYWYDQGVDFVVLRELHTAAGANHEVLQTGNSRTPCVYPWERICLSPTGMLGFCPASWLGKTKICDYRATTIKAVWQGEFMQDLRRRHLERHFQHGHACFSCQDWSLSQWPEKGKGYGDMIMEFEKKAVVE